MKKTNTSIKLDFNDLLIVPKEVTNIDSRSKIDPFRNGMLPLFTAPMDTVVSKENAELYIINDINVCLPRNVNSDLGFKSYSVSQMNVLLKEKKNKLEMGYYLIDVANGHMESVLILTKKIKKHNPKIKLMVGNIANPETYRLLSEAGADYIRVGIGNGCFIDGTLVTTITTKKSIENITIGEKVLTHTGEYRDVLETKKIPYSGELIVINDDITCTPDHEFYVLNKKYLDIINDENIDIFCEWVSALELLENPEYLLIEHNNFIDKTNEND